MDLEIRSLWSPDLAVPSEGRPRDPGHYRIFVQAIVGQKGQPGGEVLGLTICSPSQVMVNGGFITATLVLESFSWDRVRARLEKLLLSASSCGSWSEVMHRLRPYLSSDQD